MFPNFSFLILILINVTWGFSVQFSTDAKINFCMSDISHPTKYNKIRGFKIFSVTYFFLQTNPFVPNAPFLYPLKTSENLKVFWCFQGVEKRCIGNKWVKLLFRHRSNLKFFFSSAMSEEKFRTKQINRNGYVESEKVLCFSIVSTEKYPENSSELL